MGTLRGLRIRGNYPWGTWPRTLPVKGTTYVTKFSSQEECLEDIANPEYVTLEVIAHGQLGRFIIVLDDEHDAPIDWPDLEMAMRNRPPYRFWILQSCHTGDGKIPSVLSKGGNEKSCGLAAKNLMWPTQCDDLIDEFVSKLYEPANQHRPIFDLYEELDIEELADNASCVKHDIQNPTCPDCMMARDMADDPQFWGSKTMTPYDLVHISKAEAIKAIIKRFNLASSASRSEAVAVLQWYFESRKEE